MPSNDTRGHPRYVRGYDAPPGAGGESIRSERLEQIIARPLAAPAFLCAQAAVLVMVRVALALLGRCAARRQAGLEGRALRRGSGLGLPAEYASGAVAGVRAVEAPADAGDHRDNVILGHTCVGADRARRRAVAALVDAARQHGRVGDRRPRMGGENALNAHWRRLRRFEGARLRLASSVEMCSIV